MNKYQRALSNAMEICSKAEKCVSEIEKKLASWELEPDEVAKIIHELKQQKFLDEARFAGFYVNDKFRFNKWGKVKIAYMLKGKGVPNEFIYDALDQIDEEVYLESLKEMIEQKSRTTKVPTEYERKAKLIRFAQSRGFEYEVIDRALRSM